MASIQEQQDCSCPSRRYFSLDVCSFNPSLTKCWKFRNRRTDNFHHCGQPDPQKRELAFITRYILQTYLWNSASHFSKLILINFYDLPGIKSEWFGKLNALFQELIWSWHLKEKRSSRWAHVWGESGSVTKLVKTSTSRLFEGTK